LLYSEVMLTAYKNVRVEFTRYQASIYPMTVRGTYPLMVLGYAAVIAGEVSKASRSRLQTSQAVCALKTPKRLGLTGKPLANDHDEVQTLLKWLDIKPWNYRKVFNEYFVSKRPKKSKARTLKGERNAILSTSLRACVFPLRIDDTFDGKQLVEFSRAIENHTLVTLSPEESVHQKDTKQLWDRKEGARGKASEKIMRERALPKILKARMKTVHPRCGEFMYGDQGAQDYSGLGLDLEEWESLSKEEAYIDMTSKESRKQLLKETEKDWHSTRIDKLIEQILSLHESKSEGKIIITDEFLQTLDVVSNALKATGIEFLEFNGHMSLKERDAVRE